MTVTASREAAPAGEIIRAWLPIPRLLPYQNEFNLVGNSSPIVNLAPEESPIRSAFMEQRADGNGPPSLRSSTVIPGAGCILILNRK